MTKGMHVRLRNYDISGIIMAVLEDGYTVKDVLGQKYFCFESELVAVMPKGGRAS